MRIAEDVTDLGQEFSEECMVGFAKDVTAAPPKTDAGLGSEYRRQDRKDVTEFPSDELQKMSQARGDFRSLVSAPDRDRILPKLSRNGLPTDPDLAARNSQKMSRPRVSQALWHSALLSAKIAQDVAPTIHAEVQFQIEPCRKNPPELKAIAEVPADGYESFHRSRFATF